MISNILQNHVEKTSCRTQVYFNKHQCMSIPRKTIEVMIPFFSTVQAVLVSEVTAVGQVKVQQH